MPEPDSRRSVWRGIRRRWRPLLAYTVMAGIVGLVLLNLFLDLLVSRYERNAPRDPGTPYLKGMAPRELGPPDATLAVLFVHGFIGAQSNFNDLPDRVAESGYFVRTMRLPGHGTSPRDFERTSAHDLQAGVLAEVRALKGRFPKVVVVGHSLGGALATLAVAEEPVDGLVLCAPFFDLTWNRILGVPTGRIAQSLAPVVRWLPGRPGGGPVNLKANRKRIDFYHWIPMQGVLTALEIARQARSTEVCGAIAAPMFVLHSKIDTVTSQAATEQMLPAFGSASKQVLWLETSDHVVFWDYEEELVAERVLAFIEELESHDVNQPGFRE